MNDFRAVSGPVTLTCQVEGATGTVSYLWTSTCGNCFARGASQSVTQLFLRAPFDDGTHTCTATDSDGGEAGSASFVMRIIGMLCLLYYVLPSQLLLLSLSYLWLWFLVCSATVVDSQLQIKTQSLSRDGFRILRRGFLARLYM